MFRNRYEHCGQIWTDTWDCACNDRCPVCNAEIEPVESYELPANIEFAYMYRDGGNNKAGGEVVFNNDSHLSVTEISAEIEKYLHDSQFFIADQVGVPEVFLWNPDADYDPDDQTTFPEDLGPGGYVISEDIDHCYHSFFGLSETDRPATDSRTITEFLTALQRANQVGWTEFLPTDRCVTA